MLEGCERPRPSHDHLNLWRTLGGSTGGSCAPISSRKERKKPRDGSDRRLRSARICVARQGTMERREPEDTVSTKEEALGGDRATGSMIIVYDSDGRSTPTGAGLTLPTRSFRPATVAGSRLDMIAR